jgi:SagB-type dehydrogenase family enzyme
MKLRVSACGGLFWNDGHLVWDDYLEHRQFALADGTERILRWFHDWRDLESVGETGADGSEIIAEHLRRNNILIEFGSPRYRRETEVLESWGQWGLLARAFHFSTRYLRWARFRTQEQQAEALREKAITQPPPPAYKAYPGAHTVALPEWKSLWDGRDLLDVLYERRSCREFGGSAIPAQSVAAILQVAAGPVKVFDRVQAVLKTSPSGGGRHPTEVYACVRNVDGIEPGLYHYNGVTHELELIDRALDDAELVVACGDQQWAAGAGLVLFYTSVVPRNQWKYHIARSYRVMLLDLGHLSQTVYLLATALGLRMTFSAALRDEVVEEYLRCDAVSEVVLGCSVIGTAVPDEVETADV